MELIRGFLSSFKNTKGRLSRSLFFWYGTFLTVPMVGGAALIAWYLRLMFGAHPYETFSVLLFVFFLLCSPWGFSLMIQRFHDVGLSGWWILAIIVIDGAIHLLTLEVRESRPDIAILVELIGLTFYLAVCLWPGTRGDNRYGAPVLDIQSYLKSIPAQK